ncbi:MAG: DUF1552 domain-containing protein [Bryobacterales bacterium]|nr:DUF1552 domain-containing protein [Bryobacterales bacterium]
MKQLQRRTFLRGLGASVALPFLDAMSPAFAAPGRLSGETPCRMVFVYAPTGMDMRYWTPEATGSNFEIGRILKPLEDFRQDFLVLSGLGQNNGRALGDGPGDHARAAGSYLTGVHPKKTAGADIRCGISVDQIAAAKIGKQTKFSSIELGCEDGRQVGNCDSGYSCAYSNNIAWRSETAPLPPEVNPRTVFERLFGDADVTAGQRFYRKSILDYVREDAGQLRGSLGSSDRRKLNEYLDAVREIETRIENSETQAKDAPPQLEKPAGVPLMYAEHARLMFDLMVVAMQTDSTRVLTFMLGREGSTRTYPEIGVPEAHHPLTHHRNDPVMMEKAAKINCHHLEQFAYFVRKLKSTPDGAGSLLDHSMVVYGSGLADPNRHQHDDLPVLLAGRAKGRITTGRHVRYAKDTPLANLHMAMLDTMGVHTEHFADANGKLEHLTDL